MSAVAADPAWDDGGRRLLAKVDHGPLPRLSRRDLLGEIAASGLTGRGGASFSSSVKIAAVARTENPLVVANGVEGEPTSWKDKVLLGERPELVIDGAVLAAHLVGAREAVIAVGRGNRTVLERVEQAAARRSGRIDVRVEPVPDGFVAGEESALVHALEGGPAKPTATRPYKRGILVQNVETLANVALLARYGASWFRARGTREDPGTALVTVVGAVRHPGVTEVELGTPLRAVLARCGGLMALPRAILIGGYFGTWVPARDVLDVPLSNVALKTVGASLGARAIAVLPQDACGLTESIRIAHYLADQNAGQCGPCVFGLPAMAEALEALDVNRLRRLVPQVHGRGACAHPNGATRFIASAVDVFADEIHRHREGLCCAPKQPPMLPVGTSTDRRRR